MRLSPYTCACLVLGVLALVFAASARPLSVRKANGNSSVKITHVTMNHTQARGARQSVPVPTDGEYNAIRIYVDGSDLPASNFMLYIDVDPAATLIGAVFVAPGLAYCLQSSLSLSLSS
jgi:hypothetical protein